MTDKNLNVVSALYELQNVVGCFSVLESSSNKKLLKQVDEAISFWKEDIQNRLYSISKGKTSEITFSRSELNISGRDITENVEKPIRKFYKTLKEFVSNTNRKQNENLEKLAQKTDYLCELISEYTNNPNKLVMDLKKDMNNNLFLLLTMEGGYEL